MFTKERYFWKDAVAAFCGSWAFCGRHVTRYSTETFRIFAMRTAVSAEGALPVLMPFVINEDCKKTMYLEIQNISGSNVRASIKTLFSDGSYATENYMETLDGEEISLTISDYDLHPLPKETQTSYNETCSQISVCTRTKTHRILVGTSFSGILNEDTISGTFSGEFSGFCVFKKV
ncbi:MAG: hypothetical protein II821_06940 [Treponema sp.]|nr:hypothetical protein [Treponema sp.]